MLKSTKIMGRAVGKGGGIVGRMAGAGIGMYFGGFAGSGLGSTLGGVIGDGIAEQFGGVTGAEKVGKIIKAEYKTGKYLYKNKKKHNKLAVAVQAVDT
jgi:hypothetical protein